MVNKAILIGNAGADAKITEGNGVKVANVSLATTEHWKDKEGNAKESTEWHNVVMFNKLAEHAEAYVKKGAQLYVEGKIRTRNYEKGGVKHYRTDIYSDTFRILGRKPEQSSTAAQQQAEFAPISEADGPDLPF